MLRVKEVLAGRGAVNYYLEQTRRGLADHYLGEQSSPDGQAAVAERLLAPGSLWWGGGAEALRLDRPVERAQFVPLSAKGVRPDGGYLVRRFRTQEDAAAAALAYLEEHVALVRAGRNGVNVHDSEVNVA